jgi:two-component system NtrC family sensor kinase
MSGSISAPNEEELRAEIVRLNKIVKSLVSRSERAMNAGSNAFGLFQTTVLLEGQVRDRTRELEAALQKNEKITYDLQREREEQRALFRKLEETQTQLLQSEKLASIGQLAAGVAHEINNPIGFVNSNLRTLHKYGECLLRLIDAYESSSADLAEDSASKKRIEKVRHDIDLEYLRGDIIKMIEESIDGTARVRRIVLDLRDFSRMGEVEWQSSDLHAGLDSTLNLVWNEVKYKADVIKEYGIVPFVECIPSQINQIFMNLIVNAAQAIPEHGTITLRSGCEGNVAWVSVSDTGMGIPRENLSKIFNPFFTTKPPGKGTGLGLSVAYGIMKTHSGWIDVDSEVGRGTTFTIRLPVHRATGPEE